MSENCQIQFLNKCELPAIDDLENDLEPFCNTPCAKGRTSDATLKIAGRQKSSPKEDPDKEETSESVGVEEKEESIWKKVGWFALKTAAVSAAVLGGAALALSASGFGSKGPRARSLASTYQSRVLGGTIESGSAFSKLQRLGMKGLPPEAIGLAVVGSAAAVAVASQSKRKRN